MGVLLHNPLQELRKLNPRDCLIAKIIIQGAKRIREVLELKIDQIDWERNEITFRQSKTGGMLKETIISYPESVMGELRENLRGAKEGLVFITREGKGVFPTQLNRTFEMAGQRAGLSFKVSPHTLRTSSITHLTQVGFSDSEIIKLSGHMDSRMVRMYDKTDSAENISKQVNLVNGE